ncbi:hypothetical protein [Streptomyces sp. NPDC001492]
MPLITEGDTPAVLPVAGIVAAPPGLHVDAYAPSTITGVPTPSTVVAWALFVDPAAVGGMRLDPVFLAAGRAWTPDQFRAAYGLDIDLKVV